MITLLILLVFSGLSPAYSAVVSNNPAAIEFDRSLPWLNVSRPLNLMDLRGKVVILDFWTYGCINCIHVLEDIERLKEKYGEKLAIIGVHTPKFNNEETNIQGYRYTVKYHNIDTNENCRGFMWADFKKNIIHDIDCGI